MKVDETAKANRNAEIVAHMSKMSIENFKEEDDLIKREISNGGVHSGNISRTRATSKNSRRIIRFDDIEVVGNECKQKGLLKNGPIPASFSVLFSYFQHDTT